MEHSLLLIAAWQLPQYRDIALEFDGGSRRPADGIGEEPFARRKLIY